MYTFIPYTNCPAFIQWLPRNAASHSGPAVSCKHLCSGPVDAQYLSCLWYSLRKFPVIGYRILDWIPAVFAPSTNDFDVLLSKANTLYLLHLKYLLRKFPVIGYKTPDRMRATFILSVTRFQCFPIHLGHITSFAPSVFPTLALFHP